MYSLVERQSPSSVGFLKLSGGPTKARFNTSLRQFVTILHSLKWIQSFINLRSRLFNFFSNWIYCVCLLHRILILIINMLILKLYDNFRLNSTKSWDIGPDSIQIACFDSSRENKETARPLFAKLFFVKLGGCDN